MKEIFIWGIRRSGNHMLVDFILDHRKYNNISNIENSKKRQKIFRNQKVFLNDYFKDNHYEKDLKRGIVKNYPESKYRIPTPKPNVGDLQIITYEVDPFLRKQTFSNKINIFEDDENIIPEIRKEESEKYGVVILRDPFNWIASLSKDPNRLKKIDEFINTWILIAEKYFINRPNDYYFPVNYNRFVKDQNHRKELSNFLNETFTDNGIYRVSSKGSSFDKRKYDGQAEEMKIEERWKNMPNWIFKKISKNEKLIWLSETIFDFNPVKEK